MKNCYEVEERIRRHNEACKEDCVKFVTNNINKYSLEELEARLCDHCRKETRGIKHIWRYLGNSPNILCYIHNFIKS